jgi:predicted transglutaminase-like cysteine proteinase
MKANRGLQATYMSVAKTKSKSRSGLCGFLRQCLPYLLLLPFLLALCLPPVNAFDFRLLRDAMVARFGSTRLHVLDNWQTTLDAARSQQDINKLSIINDFINDNTEFLDDEVVWQQKDYWATPLELLGRGQGDCEDLAIAKYFSLKDTGVDIAKLRLVYVRALINTPTGQESQAHMVLAYYPTPLSEPLVLDNLIADIRPASQRNDLQPVFSFNHEFLWQGVSGNGPGSGGKQLTRWEDLQKRAIEEGIQ